LHSLLVEKKEKGKQKVYKERKLRRKERADRRRRNEALNKSRELIGTQQLHNYYAGSHHMGSTLYDYNHAQQLCNSHFPISNG